MRRVVAYVTEGSLGDSLIAIPTLRLLVRKYGAENLVLVSINPEPSMTAAALLGPRLKVGKSIFLAGSANCGIVRKLLRWLKVAMVIKRAKASVCIYGLRSESVQAIKRAKWHRRILGLGCRTVVGAGVEANLANFFDATGQIRAERLGRSTFERTCLGLALRVEESFDYSFPLTAEDESGGAAWLASRDLTNSAVFGVCVTSKDPASRWPLTQYKAVLRTLKSATDSVPIFIGAPTDQSLHDGLIRELGFGVCAARLDVGSKAAILKRCQFYLGNDTGTMHLAAAVHCRCVAVFSARHPVGHWFPFGEDHQVLRKRIDCEGCGLRECLVNKSKCLHLITPAEVVAACLNGLQRPPAFGA